MLVAQILLGVALEVVPVRRDLWIECIVSAVAFGLAVVFSLRRSTALYSTSTVRTPTAQVVVIAGLSGITLIGGNVLLSEVTTTEELLIPIPEFFQLMYEYPDGKLFEVVVCYGIVFATMEELLFRRVIQHGLKRAGRRHFLLWSSFLFAIAHLDPWLFPGLALMGLYLGFVYEKTGSLVPCIVGHAAFNITPEFSMQAIDAVPIQPRLVTGTALLIIFLGVISTLLAGRGDRRSGSL